MTDGDHLVDDRTPGVFFDVVPDAMIRQSIMAGGPQTAFDRAAPLFALMGDTVTLIGTRNGDGQGCKAANQIIVGVTVQAVAEALVLAAKAGADPARVRQALMGGAAASMILENHGARMLERNFEPGFRDELQQKDLNVALSAARDLGVVLPWRQRRKASTTP